MQLQFFIPWDLLFILARAALGVLALWGLKRFAQSVLLSPEPSGPASIGRAFGILILGEALGAFSVASLGVVVESVGQFSTWELIKYSLITAFCFAATFSAGFVAARTAEDTRKMNLKIFLVVGFLPHAALTLFLFMGSGFGSWALWSFFPLVILGGVLQIRSANKSLKPT
ncbi:hypothetical protein [Marinobacter shengliensis]|uniref:hypothetical protein n=1 Tax=Marinobacter shengliensis TaxID=1389223 RepID=UPI0011090CA8|nr:hypothetical protein [Marinobacter shengliensis]